MSSKPKSANKKTRTAPEVMKELVRRIERGELRVVTHGLWPGATPNVWNYHVEVVDQAVIESLREN